MKKIRVLYVQVPNGGGSLYAMYEMIKNIDRSIIEPLIICCEKNKYTSILEELDCKTIYLTNAIAITIKNSHEVRDRFAILPGRIKKESYNFYRYFRKEKISVKKIKDLLQEMNIDLVHHNNDISINRNFIRAASALGLKQIIHNRSLKTYYGDRFHLIIDSLLKKKIDFHINISNAVQNHFIKTFHLPIEKNTVIRDIVDVQKFSPNKIDTALLASLGIAQNDFVVTNVGRIISWKGQDVFIKAMQKVVAVNPNVKGLLVGSFESGIGDSAFYNVLKQLISDLGLQKNIILTGDRKDVAQIINSSSLVVHTSIKPEPQGLVILEAMFCEKPVIVSNAGGSAELAQLYGAIATEPGNVDELAESILAVISNTGKYLANQLKYKEQMDGDFNCSNQIQKIQDLYKQIIN